MQISRNRCHCEQLAAPIVPVDGESLPQCMCSACPELPCWFDAHIGCFGECEDGVLAATIPLRLAKGGECAFEPECIFTNDLEYDQTAVCGMRRWDCGCRDPFGNTISQGGTAAGCEAQTIGDASTWVLTITSSSATLEGYNTRDWRHASPVVIYETDERHPWSCPVRGEPWKVSLVRTYFDQDACHGTFPCEVCLTAGDFGFTSHCADKEHVCSCCYPGGVAHLIVNAPQCGWNNECITVRSTGWSSAPLSGLPDTYACDPMYGLGYTRCTGSGEAILFYFWCDGTEWHFAIYCVNSTTGTTLICPPGSLVDTDCCPYGKTLEFACDSLSPCCDCPPPSSDCACSPPHSVSVASFIEPWFYFELTNTDVGVWTGPCCGTVSCSPAGLIATLRLIGSGESCYAVLTLSYEGVDCATWQSGPLSASCEFISLTSTGYSDPCLSVCPDISIAVILTVFW